MPVEKLRYECGEKLHFFQHPHIFKDVSILRQIAAAELKKSSKEETLINSIISNQPSLKDLFKDSTSLQPVIRGAYSRGVAGKKRLGGPWWSHIIYYVTVATLLWPKRGGSASPWTSCDYLMLGMHNRVGLRCFLTSWTIWAKTARSRTRARTTPGIDFLAYLLKLKLLGMENLVV